MRGVLLAVSLVTGCGFERSDSLAPIDARAEEDLARVVRDDTASDFGMAGSLAENVAIEPWGTVAPAAYHVGGLVAHSANVMLFTDPTSATWEAIVSSTVAGTGIWSKPLFGDPVGVGLNSGDSWTCWAEGEVWLEAGETTFLIDADDVGFLEIAHPGGSFERVANANLGVSAGMFSAGAAGWYPIRLAVAESIGSSRFDVELYAGSSGNPTPLGSTRLRARVDGLRGMVLSGWDGSLFGGRPEQRVWGGPLLDAIFANAAPVDLGIGASDSWSLRWSGQFYADVGGTYSLRVRSDDGHRLYVGSELVSDALLTTGLTERTVDVLLQAGWNDLVLDLNENTGDARIQLAVVGGPEPGLDGDLPVARLRPLAPRSERLETAADTTDRPIPDNTGMNAQSSVSIGAFTGATVTSVDVVVSVNHPRIADVQIRLIEPSGDEVLLRNNSTDGGSGPRTFSFTTEAFDEKLATGTWSLRVTDTSLNQTGTLTDFQLVVHMHGGPDQVARFASYTSAVRDLGDRVNTFESIRLGAQVPDGASVAVRLRSCDAPTECETAMWSASISEGDPLEVSAARYMQYKVELTTAGEREPEVDWVEFAYRIAPM